jgi:hypothetical protein
MGWFNHRPRPKENSKLFPHTTSPMAEQQLKELKNRVKPLGQKTPKKK